MCVHVCRCASRHACGGYGLTSGISPYQFPSSFLRQGLSLTLCHADTLPGDWPAPGILSPFLLDPQDWVTDSCLWVWLLLGYWGSNPRSRHQPSKHPARSAISLPGTSVFHLWLCWSCVLAVLRVLWSLRSGVLGMIDLFLLSHLSLFHFSVAWLLPQECLWNVE